MDDGEDTAVTAYPVWLTQVPRARIVSIRGRNVDVRRCGSTLGEVPTVLVVDDEASILDVVTYALGEAGFTTVTAKTGPAALETVRREQIDLVILDVMLPGIDGFTVCREIRATSAVPIILLTARDDELDRVVGLELGADDYVVKPFGVRELVARVRALLRRSELGAHTPQTERRDLSGTASLTLGHIRIDLDQHVAHWIDTPLELTRIQFDLLAWFVGRPRRVFAREELLEQVWGQSYTGDLRSVDSMVKRLRSRLRAAGAPDDLIVGVRDVGYRMHLPD